MSSDFHIKVLLHIWIIYINTNYIVTNSKYTVKVITIHTLFFADEKVLELLYFQAYAVYPFSLYFIFFLPHLSFFYTKE